MSWVDKYFTDDKDRVRKIQKHQKAKPTKPNKHRSGVQTVKLSPQLKRTVMASRSSHANKIDRSLKAEIPKDETKWRKDPSRYDLKGIDTPNSKDPEPKKTKPVKVKTGKTKFRHKMSGLERLHLQKQADEFGIDPQEIDPELTYSENKKHLNQIARNMGISETEIRGLEGYEKKVDSQYEQYLESLKTELENNGYVVTSPVY